MEQGSQDTRDRNPTWPTFLIVGSAKAGTTSVYHYLEQHPQVYMSPVKEPQYFSLTGQGRPKGAAMIGVTPTQEKYLELFKGVSDQKAVGEASTAYLLSPTAAKRIAEAIPDVKIIIILRNPADRAFSGYLMQLRNATDNGRVEEAFDSDKKYVRHSFYYENISRYIEYFPREQIGFFLFEELRKNPDQVMRRVYRFLGVDDNFQAEIQQHNQAWVPKYRLLNSVRERLLRSEKLRKALQDTAIKRWFRRLTRVEPPRMTDEIYQRLIAYYREDIEKTQRLTGLDLSSWLNRNLEGEGRKR